MPDASGPIQLPPRGLRPAGRSTDDALLGRLQELTAAIARDESSFDAATRAEVLAIFDARAATWSERRSSAYLFPLVDALRRGDVAHGGRCCEVGSGSGLQTVTLASHFDAVVNLDLSVAMLAADACGCAARIAADGAHLPVASGSLDAVVLVNSFLFPREVARVLAPGGVLVHVSVRAEHTPIYLPSEEVLAALRASDPAFAAVASRAAEGSWTVARRVDQ